MNLFSEHTHQKNEPSNRAALPTSTLRSKFFFFSEISTFKNKVSMNQKNQWSLLYAAVDHHFLHLIGFLDSRNRKWPIILCSDFNDNQSDCFHGITNKCRFSLLWGWLESSGSLFFISQIHGIIAFQMNCAKIACHAAKGCQESSRHLVISNHSVLDRQWFMTTSYLITISTAQLQRNFFSLPSPC